VDEIAARSGANKRMLYAHFGSKEELWLTVLDTVTLGLGLWLLGFPGPWALGLICAVLAWIPYVGSILGGLLVVLYAYGYALFWLTERNYLHFRDFVRMKAAPLRAVFAPRV
jgi:AcrR family transcriptional regulator